MKRGNIVSRSRTVNYYTTTFDRLGKLWGRLRDKRHICIKSLCHGLTLRGSIAAQSHEN